MAETTGTSLVNSFRQLEHVRYLWGGSDPISGWDCSGAVNWVCGFIYKLAIPGFGPGQFRVGSGHGPVVADWIQWSGVTRGSFGPVQPRAGDLIAWAPNVHMGMAINSTRFVSAANPNQGTIEADIGSFFNYAPFVLRLLQVRIGASLPSIPAAPGPGRDDYSPTIVGTSRHLGAAGQSAYKSAVAIRELRR